MRLSVVFPLYFLAACSSIQQATLTTEKAVTDFVRPYRLDVRQGNVLTQEMVAQLKPGLTREQVRFILGTPLLTDPFHANRWDYVYRLQSGYDAPRQRNLTVYFEGNKLVSVGGDVAASDPAQAASEPLSAAREIDIAPDPNGPKTEPDIKIPPREDEEGQQKKGRR